MIIQRVCLLCTARVVSILMSFAVPSNSLIVVWLKKRLFTSSCSSLHASMSKLNVLHVCILKGAYLLLHHLSMSRSSLRTDCDNSVGTVISKLIACAGRNSWGCASHCKKLCKGTDISFVPGDSAAYSGFEGRGHSIRSGQFKRQAICRPGHRTGVIVGLSLGRRGVAGKCALRAMPPQILIRTQSSVTSSLLRSTMASVLRDSPAGLSAGQYS